jgi:hypothetical protein
VIIKAEKFCDKFFTSWRFRKVGGVIFSDSEDWEKQGS